LALKVGMTPQQFWEEDPELMWAYLEAERMRNKEKMQYDNSFAHLQGTYYLMALQQVLQFSKHPKKIYPKKPFDLKLEIEPAKPLSVRQKEYEEMREIQLKEMCKRFNNQQSDSKSAVVRMMAKMKKREE
jgi:hypothetical protein